MDQHASLFDQTLITNNCQRKQLQARILGIKTKDRFERIVSSLLHPTMTFSRQPPAASHVSSATHTIKQDGEARISEEEIVDIVAEKRLLRRLDIRIIPSFALMLLLSSLASGNVGNAIVLNAETGDSLLQVLHITENQFLAIACASLASYTLFQIPSSYMLKYFSPPYWLAFLMLGWGATLMTMAASQNYITVLVLRLVLGAFEAGIAPGMIYFFTFWYRLQERALRISLIVASSPLGAAFGGCIAYGVGHLNGVRGLEGWRWLFLFEGAPSCLLAIFVYLFLPSYPETSTWLSPDDRALAVRRMKQESSKSVGYAKVTWDGAKLTLKDGRLYLHYLLGIVALVPLSSILLFAPTIIYGLGYEGQEAQLLTIPPYAAAFVATVATSWLSDRYKAWSKCGVVSMTLAGVTFIVQGMPRSLCVLPPTSFKARYALLCLGLMFSFMYSPSLSVWFTGNLRDTNATTLAIPISAACGTVGQVVGIFIYRPSEAPGYPTGHYTNAALLFTGAIGTQVLRMIYTKRNRHLAVGESPWIV
ncbi:MFS general substrate transporter [Desarmillaria tabescens]|uniref:MFS general substrate transporter n=1 Tax=Armillaria tabescens TaxID=1929756 RepID=A0AA39JG54_ARMTA|nr:MFS general substrate transporter [Desarmillaria tabescens]KAK0442028.1 MFS general substrate transporter [Desarmillaria tabescens]